MRSTRPHLPIRKKPPEYRWANYDDDALLKLRVSSLRLRDSLVWPDVEQLRDELERRGGRYSAAPPHRIRTTMRHVRVVVVMCCTSGTGMRKATRRKTSRKPSQSGCSPKPAGGATMRTGRPYTNSNLPTRSSGKSRCRRPSIATGP